MVKPCLKQLKCQFPKKEFNFSLIQTIIFTNNLIKGIYREKINCLFYH